MGGGQWMWEMVWEEVGGGLGARGGKWVMGDGVGAMGSEGWWRPPRSGGRRVMGDGWVMARGTGAVSWAVMWGQDVARLCWCWVGGTHGGRMAGSLRVTCTGFGSGHV